MKLTEPKDASMSIMQNYDADRHEAMYRRQKFAFGHRYEASGAASGSADFPMFPDIESLYHEVGIGRNIVTAQFLAAASACYTDPQPEFPQLLEHDAKVRKALLMARRRGVPDFTDKKSKGQSSGGWKQDDISVVLDGDGLGFGCLEMGLETGESGLQRLTARHSSCLHTVGDRSSRNPDKWRHITFIDFISEDQAIALYGEGVKAQVTQFYDSGSAEAMRLVPIIRRYDLGHGKGNPTLIVWAGSHTLEPVMRVENPFKCLPFSYYVNMFYSGMRYATGRIEQQMPLESIRNEIEREIMAIARGGASFDILNESMFEEEDLKAILDGKPMPYLRLKKGFTLDDKTYQRIPTRDIPNQYFTLLDYYFRHETMASGVNEFQRGAQLDSKRTATEVQAVAQEGDTPQAWMSKRLSEYYVRTFEVGSMIAKKFDKAPVMLDIDGAQVLFNNPEDPYSMISEYFKAPSTILVSEQTLRYRDQQAEQARELAKWMSFANPQLAAFLGIDPAYLRDKILLSMGEKDPSKAYAQQAQNMGAAPMPMPVQNVPA